MIHSQIYFGSTSTPTFAFDDSNILKASCVLSVDLTGSELAQDEMDVTVLWEKIGENAQVFAPADYDALMTSEGLYFATNYAGTDDLTTIPYGTPVWFYFNGSLLGKFFFKKATRSGRDQYKVTIVSAVGLLGNLIDKGGIFKAVNGDTFLTVLNGIIGGSVGAKANGMYPITGGVFDCLVDEQAAAQIIEGWLPYATKRENLHQLLFAESISLTKATDGTPLFSYLFDNPTPTELDDSKIYINGDVNYQDAATAVEVTEHTFLDLGTSDELVTLFDGAASGTASNTLITFNEPIHGDSNGDLIATNVTVHEWGANYAIITGSGTLQGYKYTHSKQTVRRAVVDPPGAENEYAITNVTLISPLNSGNVADRLLAYYSASNTIDMDIVKDGEDPQVGRQYSFNDPFGDPKTGFVTRMDLTPSGIMKARCHIVTDYTPTGHGNNYRNASLFIRMGNWIVPAGVTSARLVLIGGGKGGSAGSDGADGGLVTVQGWSGVDTSTATGGAGGTAGTGGTGGRVKTVDLTGLTQGTIISYNCGKGGSGGSYGNPTLALVNGVTYSTADQDASIPPNGVVNLLTGDVYAVSGKNGLAGADGGHGAPTGYGRSGDAGENLESYTGGAGGQNRVWHDDVNGRLHTVVGGGGGGAAYGANGNDATPPTGDPDAEYSGDNGNGGDGADASTPSEIPSYGSGGGGGNGGGGGGGSGVYGYRDDGSSYVFSTVGLAGKGGKGSNGKKGGDGCVLIYY